MQPSTMSDVYSFGVVLLELVTGRPAIQRDPEPTSVIPWARQRLARGNIEGVVDRGDAQVVVGVHPLNFVLTSPLVVDARMRGDHDVNGVWRAATVALECTAQAPADQPTMADVVAQLQECLDLEEGRAATANFVTADGQSVGVSQSSTASEVEQNFGREPTMDKGPVAR
ncbi:hypothetical protein ACP70R_034043 [Stipagrostis hirtigluma subsp. patula]